MTATREFSLAGYRSLLEAFTLSGYEVTDFDEVDPEKPHLILRHDVDMSLQAAEKIGIIEKELGVSSYYFVLLRSEMYNLFSNSNLKVIENLKNLGHQIGLHFDSSLYGKDEMDEAAEWESECLQCLTGIEVKMISFHRPAQHLLGDGNYIAGRQHTYQPKFFEAITYCSDSRGEWSHGHPLDLPAFHKKHSIQLLTHPIWWIGNSDSGPISQLDTFIKERDLIIRRELAHNCKPFQKAYGAFDSDTSLHSLTSSKEER